MSPWIRIILRYGSGFFVAKGMITAGTAETIASDPDIYQSAELIIGLIVGAATEAWYFLAARYGWAK